MTRASALAICEDLLHGERRRNHPTHTADEVSEALRVVGEMRREAEAAEQDHEAD